MKRLFYRRNWYGIAQDGRRIGEVPKSYRMVGVGHDGKQNRLARVYVNRAGRLVAEIYTEGNFFPLYSYLTKEIA